MARHTVLVLGGTTEAAELARRIASTRPDDRLIVSLAGLTRAPACVPGERRVGGFGGAAGLAQLLDAEGVTRLVDATHPFAAGMSRGAAEAAVLGGVRRLALMRAPWGRQAGDFWLEASCLGRARDLLPDGARPFLALGSRHLGPFRHRTDLRAVLRAADPPAEPLPFELVVGPPLSSAAEEAALFRRLGITHLVCRNSGGAAGYAKLEAARLLGLPVVMIARPPAPLPPVVDTVEAVMAWLTEPV